MSQSSKQCKPPYQDVLGREALVHGLGLHLHDATVLISQDLDLGVLVAYLITDTHHPHSISGYTSTQSQLE